MPSSSKPGAASRRAGEAESRNAGPMAMAAGWFLPGAGHFLQGQFAKAAVFFVVLTSMFAIGLAFGGRLFPFQVSDPLVFMAALAEWMIGLPRFVAGVGGFGQGQVVAATYEYGNTFLITAGILNMLTALDAFDVAAGRKAR